MLLITLGRLETFGQDNHYLPHQNILVDNEPNSIDFGGSYQNRKTDCAICMTLTFLKNYYTNADISGRKQSPKVQTFPCNWNNYPKAIVNTVMYDRTKFNIPSDESGRYINNLEKLGMEWLLEQPEIA